MKKSFGCCVCCGVFLLYNDSTFFSIRGFNKLNKRTKYLLCILHKTGQFATKTAVHALYLYCK